jgi:hypothetical protein
MLMKIAFSCCSQWGHCDTAESHCASKAKSGEVNLGTTGCISNCGISIVNNDVPPKQFIKIAYL